MRNYETTINHCATFTHRGYAEVRDYELNYLVDQLVKLLEVPDKINLLKAMFDPCMLSTTSPEGGWTSYFTPAESRSVGAALCFVQGVVLRHSCLDSGPSPVVLLNLNTGRNLLLMEAIPHEGLSANRAWHTP